MKRIGFLLVSCVALVALFTLALAQLEARSAKYLLRALSGDEVRGYFGCAMEGAYPWTGGKPMFAVAACGEISGPVRSGKITFYDGLLASTPALTVIAPQEGELFGRALSGGGDWNGDGQPDLAVGAPCGESATVKSPAGKVYLYFGGADFGKSFSWVSAGEASDGFGESVDLKNDLNGDGLADLVVGAPHSAKSGATAGRAYVWFGKKDGKPAQSPDVAIKLGTTNDFFGSSIATGDLNGDKQADLAIGAPYHNIEAKMCGGVFVFLGGKEVNFERPTQVINGECTSFQDEFGRSVAILSDMNGDGFGELAVGAPQVTSGGAQFGKVYIYAGAQKIGPAPLQTFAGTSEAARFGQVVFSVGDLNKDGKGDWAVQAENASSSRGVLSLFYGGWETSFYAFSGEMIGDRLGASLAVLGDLDGNGSREVLVGAPWNDTEAENAGRAYVLAFE